MVILTFPREHDMCARLARLTEAFGAKSWNVFREFQAPQGVPDLVFACFSDEAAEVRARSPLVDPIPDRRHASVILALRERSHQRAEEVARAAKLALSTTKAVLRELSLCGLVERNPRGWRRVGPCPPRLDAAIAVELKLRDWRRALDQAARYKNFAEQSFVVLDERHAHPAATHRSIFRFNGVGLASLSPWGVVTHIQRVRPRRPHDAVARFVAGERLWLAHCCEPGRNVPYAA